MVVAYLPGCLFAHDLPYLYVFPQYKHRTYSCRPVWITLHLGKNQIARFPISSHVGRITKLEKSVNLILHQYNVPHCDASSHQWETLIQCPSPNHNQHPLESGVHSNMTVTFAVIKQPYIIWICLMCSC